MMKKIAEMKQETFNNVMTVTLAILVLAAVFVTAPGALDQWWDEQYEQHSEIID